MLSPLVMALLVGPTVLPLLRVAQGAIIEDDTALRGYGRAVRRLALRGVLHLLGPALALTSLLAAIAWYAQSRSVLAIPSLVLTATVSLLALAALPAVLPCAAARPRLGFARPWLTGLHLIGRHPLRFLAPVAAGALALWLASSTGSFLVLLLPAPIALLAEAAYWCCAVELGAEDLVPDVPVEDVG